MPGAALQCPQPPLQKQEGAHRRFVLLGDGIGDLDHGPRGEHPIQIGPQPGMGLDHRNLGDRVEVAPLVEHEVDMGEGLEPPPETALRLAHPFGHRPDLAGVGTEENDHPVGLPKGEPAEDDPLVAAQAHRW